jgi:hypothetical protein
VRPSPARIPITCTPRSQKNSAAVDDAATVRAKKFLREFDDASSLALSSHAPTRAQTSAFLE